MPNRPATSIVQKPLPESHAPIHRDFEKEEAKLRKGLDGNERWKAVGSLQILEEEWARALVGAKSDGSIKIAMKAAAGPKLDPNLALEAAKHLANAEKWAWDYASYATSGAEGCVAMGSVRAIQFAHAWMLVAASANAKSRARCAGGSSVAVRTSTLMSGESWTS